MPQRIHRTESEWRTIIEQQQSSGQNGLAFCRQQGLNPKSFYRWRKRIAPKVEAAESFIQVKRPSVGLRTAGLVLIYRDCHLQLPEQTDPQWLSQLIRGLA